MVDGCLLPTNCDAATATPAKTGARILLAEDNAVNQRVATLMLQKLGCEVVLARDGREAVSAYSMAAFDAILMDIQMPVMDGFSAAQAIRELEAGGGRRPTPIIAVTALAFERDRERCLAGGMDGYLTKPLRLDDLRASLAGVLRCGTRAAAFLLLVAGLCSPAAGQTVSEVGDPVIRNFAPTDYEASGQNWSLLQDASGILYVANTDGILEFDGARWRRIETSRRASVRSLALDENGRIHASGLNDLGYLVADPQGQLAFHSLLPEVPQDLQPLGDVWTVAPVGDAVYYRAGSSLLRWSPDSGFRRYRELGAVSGLARMNDHVIAHTHQGVLWRVGRDGVPHELPNSRIASDRMTFAVPHGANGLLIGTYDVGLFVYDGTGVRRFGDVPVDELSRAAAYCVAALHNGEYAVGTTSAGVFVFAADGRLVRRITKRVGVRDDSIFSAYADNAGGLWLGTTDGLSRVAYPSYLSRFGEQRGLPGVITDVARHDGRIWAATARGIFHTVSAGGRLEFTRAPHAGGQCWRLWPTEAGLVSACTGHLEVTADTVVRTLARGTFQALQRSSRLPGLLLAAGDGITLMRLSGGRWSHAGAVPGLAAKIRFLSEDRDGQIWAGSLTGELFRIRITGSEEAPVFDIARFGASAGLPLGPIHTLAPDGAIMLRTVDGLYRMRDAGGDAGTRFERAPETSGKELPFRQLMISRTLDAAGRLWLTRPDGLVALPRRAGGGFDFEATPLAPISATGNNVIVVDAFDVVWIGRQDGLLRLDAAGASAAMRPALAAAIRRVVDLDTGQQKHGGAVSGALTLAADVSALRFEYSTPSFTAGTVYQTRLIGFDRRWSEWQPETARVYTNLPGGSYTFEVRARTGDGFVTQDARLPVRIELSWFERRSVQVAVALTLTVAAVGVGRGINRIRLRRLSELVRVRTAELADTVLKLREQKHAAEVAQAAAQEAERARAAFVAAVSHEVRAPLNGVIGMTSLLQCTSLDSEQSTYVDTIRSSGDALLGAINDILDYSKLEAGRLELEAQTFNPREPVDDALQVASSAAVEKGVRLGVTVAPDVPRAIVADPVRFRQILVNLVNNAVKYTDRGSVRVALSGEFAADDASTFRLQVSVIDTGVGIPGDQLARLFQPFSQLKGHRGGTGLGLSICRQLVEMMGGRIWAESEPGRGSTFHFQVPVARLAEAAHVWRSGAAAAAAADLRVLVACTDSDRAGDLRQSAAQSGFPASMAMDAGSLLGEVASDNPPGIVLLDEAFAAPLGEAVLATAATRSQFVLLRSLEHSRREAPRWAATVLLEPVRESRLVETLVHLSSAAATPHSSGAPNVGH